MYVDPSGRCNIATREKAIKYIAVYKPYASQIYIYIHIKKHMFFLPCGALRI
jgi:hypothetical protein